MKYLIVLKNKVLYELDDLKNNISLIVEEDIMKQKNLENTI